MTGARPPGARRRKGPCGAARPRSMMGAMTVHTATPARLGETRLPDGRLLGWAEWGPQEGTPVLLCPGADPSQSGCPPR